MQGIVAPLRKISVYRDEVLHATHFAGQHDRIAWKAQRLGAGFAFLALGVVAARLAAGVIVADGHRVIIGERRLHAAIGADDDAELFPEPTEVEIQDAREDGHEDKEAPIDTETAILVDENLPEDEDDIGQIKGEFAKKNENKFQGFHSSPRTPMTTTTYYKGGQSESSNTFRNEKPSTFPSSVGTVTPASSVRGGMAGSNSRDDSSSGSMPLFGGYEHRSQKLTPLVGYGDAIKVGDWVLVYFEQDTQKPKLEYNGEALKVISYSSIGYIDLMHQDESVTKTLYRGPNWCKTFKIVKNPKAEKTEKADPKPNDFQSRLENDYSNAPESFWDSDLPPIM